METITRKSAARILFRVSNLLRDLAVALESEQEECAPYIDESEIQ